MTLSIVAITAAIAVPRFASATNRSGAEAAARRLAAGVERVRERVRLAGVPATVTFSVGTGRVRVTGLVLSASETELEGFDLSESPYGATIVSAKFGLLAEVTFDARGFPNSIGQVVVGRGVFERTIQIDDIGRARW